jgi:hypothetical protein
MKIKHTLFLVVLAAAIFSYIYFVDKKMPTTTERQEKKGRLFDFDRDEIAAIAIKTPEAKIALKRDGSNWLVEEPVKDRADAGTLASLLTSIELLRSESTIDNEGKGVTKEQLKEFGFTESQTKITLTVKDKPIQLTFGSDTAVANRVYAMLDGSKSVEIVPTNLRDDITRKPDEFRDKKLSDISLNQLKKAIIKSKDGEIELEKTDDQWALIRPLKARADEAKVGDLLSQAFTARIESFAAEPSKLAEYGLESPVGTVSFIVEGSEQPQVLSFGTSPTAEADKEKIYARLSSRDAVVLLQKNVASILEKKPNDLRDQRLMRFNNDLVDRISIEPAGKPKLVLARDGAKGWQLKGEKDSEINASLVTKLLDDLAASTVTTFVSDVATDLATYGLDQPVLKVTLSAYSSENTAETQAGEKPITAVHFGKTKDGETYAKLDDEPFIVAVPFTLLDAILTDPLQFQALEIFKNKPEDIVSFEITREGQPPLSIERDKDQNWKLAKGDDKLNTINVQSLVNTLSNLRAVRWVGATTPEHGFEKPAVVVSFKTSGNTSGKLTIGSPQPDEMRHAAAEGLTGTFLLARPDYDAFVAGLLDKPAPAADAPGAPGAPNAPAVGGGDGASAPAEAATPPVPVPAPAPAEEAAKPAPDATPSEVPQTPEPSI